MKPIDQEDQPIPWIPYCAVDFLAERLTSGLSVLEFGAGYSTLFFMRRVARVVSLEHDPEWLGWIRSRIGANVTLLATESDTPDSYLAPLERMDDYFDLILVDGIHRTAACSEAIGRLTPTGVVLLDDSDRPKYSAAFSAASSAGFRQLHFVGHKAASVNLYRTTVFYRDGNCLGI